MSEITYSTTAEIGIGALTRTVNAVFHDLPYEHEPYPLPPPEDFATNYRVYDADLGHSVVARDGDRIVGVAVLARRADRAYLVDFGILPEYRRRGIGRRMMDVFLEETRRTGARTVVLAADAGKTANPAVRLYKSAGFRTVREFFALQGKAAGFASDPAAADVRPSDLIKVLDWYGGGRSAPPMWERELPSLLAETDARALLAVRDGSERAFLVYASRPVFDAIELLHLGLAPEAQPEDVRALLATASREAPSARLLDQGEPIDSRWHRLLLAAGLREAETLLEMARDL